MIKFEGHGIVWNPESDRELCVFKDGVYETNDKTTAEKLMALGYKSSGKISKDSKDNSQNSEEDK